MPTSASLIARLIWISIPLVILLVLISWFFVALPTVSLTPVVATESLAVERVKLEPGRFDLIVRNDGSEALSIAQVTINDAAWISLVLPKTTIEPLARANILLEDYEWISGQSYQIVIYTTKANTFTISIPQANVTPRLTQPNLQTLLLTGFLVGLLPIYIGFFWWPFLRQLYVPAWLVWLCFALTVFAWQSLNLLLVIPQIISQMPTVFQGWGLLVIGLVGSVAGFYWWYIQPQDNETKRHLLRGYRLAIVMGVFSFGEGIILGYFVSGGITTDLLWIKSPLWVVGFLILNSSKGIILALSFSESRPLLMQWILVGFIAGFPALLGLLVGAFPLAMSLIVIALGLFVGAILWLIIEMLVLARNENEGAYYWGQLAVGVISGLAVTWVVNFFVVFG